MTTQEQYNEALRVISNYKREKLRLNYLGIGDFVIFSKSGSKHILIGKPYEVVQINDDWANEEECAYFSVMGDNNKLIAIRKKSTRYTYK
jgi:hypothetical protein